MNLWILDKNGNPVICRDWKTWAEWIEKPENRQTQRTQVGIADISTVFMGIDHRYSGAGRPILWETMVFGGDHDNYTRRYSSLKDAVRGHKDTVKMVSEDSRE